MGDPPPVQVLAGGAFRAPELAAAEEAQRLRERATSDEWELALLVERRTELERQVARERRVLAESRSPVLGALALFAGFVAGFVGASWPFIYWALLGIG